MYMKSTTNLVISKLRALYGQRLTVNDYDELINKYSIAGVASYLKNETLYKTTLASINENFIHRGQLELLLKISNFGKYINFFYYKIDENINIFKYIVMKNELEQMMTAIRLFNTGKMEKYAMILPVFLLKYTKIDLRKLAAISNFDDLMDVVKGTIYFQPLKICRPSNGKIDIVRCETELRKAFYNFAISLLDKNDNNTRNVFFADIEIFNISVIYRLKKFFNKDKDYIKSCLIPFFYYLNQDLVNKLIDATSQDDFYQILLTTQYRKYCNKEVLSDISFFSKKILYNILNKGIRFTTSAQYIMICYMYLMDIELKNIITIIECIGYKFSPEEIRKLLII